MTSATGFNIQDFKSNIGKDGVLQTNKFLVTINQVPPSQLLGSEDVKLLQFRASDIRIPGVSFETLNTHRYGIGPTQKFPTNVNFTDIGITFIEDKYGSIWNLMNNWTRDIFGYGGNYKSEYFYKLDYKSSYSTEIVISVFNNEGTSSSSRVIVNDNVPVIRINLVDAYPVSMHDVPLSWSENNNLFRTTVDFTFRDYNIV